LGIAGRLRGHSRVPLPPQRMTGVIFCSATNGNSKPEGRITDCGVLANAPRLTASNRSPPKRNSQFNFHFEIPFSNS
jgi:hypothetical protein